MTHPAGLPIEEVVVPHYGFSFLRWYNNVGSLTVLIQVEAVTIFAISKFLRQEKETIFRKKDAKSEFCGRRRTIYVKLTVSLKSFMSATGKAVSPPSSTSFR